MDEENSVVKAARKGVENFRKNISDRLLKAVDDRKAQIDEEDAKKAKGVTEAAKQFEKDIGKKIAKAER